MKKLYILIVVLLIIATLPIINGFLLEKTIQSVADSLNEKYQKSGIGYQVKLINYDRRLYSSEIEWRFDFGQLKTIYGIDGITIKDHAQHRFTYVKTSSDLMNNAWYNKIVTEKAGGVNPLAIATRYSLFGKITSTVTNTPFSIEAEGQTVKVAKGSLSLTTNRDFSYVKATGALESLSGGETLQLRDLTISSDLESISPFIWAGQVALAIGRLQVVQDTEQVDIHKIRTDYDLDFSPAQKKISLRSDISTDSFTTGSLSVHNITGRFELLNLSSDGYDAFMQQYIEIMAPLVTLAAEQKQKETETMQELEQQLSVTGLQIIGAFEKLLTKGLEMKISNVSMSFPEGDLKATVNIKLLKDMTLMQFAPLLGQPALALDIFALNSDMQLPAKMFASFPALTTPLYHGMKTGLFIEKDEVLTHHAETNEKQLLLNGTIVDLSPQQH